ncbi:MAG TPA: zinc-binding alcohol dehydrogenase [Nocardioidaceae bacterium]|jgi:3-hydroxyethyl bacteriochlorophyllide a dehydrogenase
MRAPAIVFAEPKRIEIKEMDLPEVGPGQVGIRTAFSGVSQGTERWALTGRYGHYDHDYSAYYPCSPGYQAAGVVDVVGSEVDSLATGDHVFTMGTHFADPVHKYPGPCQASHSAYLVANAAEVWRVDPGVDLAGASLFHMAGVSRHGVRLTGVEPDDLVVVIGLGMIGQMSAQAARHAGARVVATDLIRLRVEAAARHSADRGVDPEAESLEEVVRTEHPDGADVVIDTTGVARMFDRCLDLVKYEGKIVMQGYYPDPISIDFHPTHLKRPHVVFPCGWDDEFNDDLADDMAKGSIAIDPLITHRMPYRDAHQVYELVVDHPEQSLGMVLDWSGA